MSVRYEVTDHVAVITIDRPQKKNAMNDVVFRQLGEHARRAAEDDDARAVLVHGEGDTFSSGIDVGLLGGQLEDGVDEDFIIPLQEAFTAYEDIDKPTVAAIAGPCFGAGIQLAAACHLRCVTPSASLAVMEVRWSLVPDLGGTLRLPRLVGLGRATELTLTGRRVDAEEALRIGLAEIAVEDIDEAFAFTARLARGPRAVRLAPRLLRENLSRGVDDASAAERRTQVGLLTGPDFAEAVTAHLQGRDPDFLSTT
ncbi:MAG: enoyl-CoA hydratase/isomerase family protein [Actinobacteria bacterium]|nr:enoyl-CoA hydratase/isomerase family protein [Actinomycetota bacterium]